MGVLRDTERSVIEHSLGINSRNKTPYRNHFCAGEGHADLPYIKSLVALGFMRASHTINDGRDTIYVVTDAGKAALQKVI